MSVEVEGREAAERFRRDHHLGVQPLGDLIAIIEQTLGVDVAVLDAGPDEHGLTMRDPEHGAVVMGVARTRNPMRQRSTLAHEVGHVLFGDGADDAGEHAWAERTPQEIRADAFARHLLVPLPGLRLFLSGQGPVSVATLSAVVQCFLVSPAVAAIALHQAGYVDEATKQEWMAMSTPQLAVRFGWGDHYQALQADSDRRRAPQRLLARAIRGYEQGVLSAQAIATLRGVPLAVAEADLREAGIVPADHSTPWAGPEELPAVQVDWDILDADMDVPGDTGSQAAGEQTQSDGESTG
jgi:Zn-dependent peptidase ImmA (M78 family)